MPTIPLGGGLPLTYELDGPAPAPVVALVGGLGDRRDDWADLPSALVADGRRVLRWDQRGSTEAATTPGPYTTALMAADAATLAAAVGIAEIDVVGFSLGGAIAQEWALAQPRSIRSLTLVSTFARPDEAAREIFSGWRRMLAEEGVGAVLDDCWRRSTTAPAPSPRPATGWDPPAAGYAAQLDALLAHDSLQRLAGLTARTLVVAAAGDAIVAPAASRELAAAIPGADWALVDGGHAALVEAPDPLVATVSEFLRQVPAR